MGLDLPRHRLIRLDIRAVLDLLHSQVDGEVAQGPIRSPQDRKWQKDFATREPLAGVDDQPSNGPADILKQQVANCPEQPIARLDGIAPPFVRHGQAAQAEAGEGFRAVSLLKLSTDQRALAAL